jgi:hypothetical protein
MSTAEPVAEPTTAPEAAMEPVGVIVKLGDELGDAGKKAIDAHKAKEYAAKAEAAEARKEIEAVRKELAQLQERDLNEVQKAQKAAERQADALAEAQREAAVAKQESLRWRIATQHAISADDAELFLTGATEEQMTAQAKRLAENFAAQAAAAQQPQGLRPDLSQGARGGGQGNAADQFSSAVSSLFL